MPLQDVGENEQEGKVQTRSEARIDTGGNDVVGGGKVGETQFFEGEPHESY
jgi:hypothetical protein